MGSVKDEPDNIACEPALLALGKEPTCTDVPCNLCPFPFCIMSEARNITMQTKERLALELRRIGNRTLNDIASTLGISQRTIQRKAKVASECYWCGVELQTSNVLCRDNTCTVALKNDNVVVSLGEHHLASNYETKLVHNLIGNIFPDGVLVHRPTTDATHSGWVVTRVSKDETNAAVKKMDYLSQFDSRLR